MQILIPVAFFVAGVLAVYFVNFAVYPISNSEVRLWLINLVYAAVGAAALWQSSVVAMFAVAIGIYVGTFHFLGVANVSFDTKRRSALLSALTSIAGGGLVATLLRVGLR